MSKLKALILALALGATPALADAREDCHTKSGDIAIRSCSALISLNRNDASAYNKRGIAYTAKKDYDNAIADFTKAIEIDSLNIEAIINRSTAYLGKKDFDHAILDCERAAASDRRNLKALFCLEAALEGKGDQRGKDASARLLGIFIATAAICRADKDLARRLEACDELIRRRPKDAAPYVNRGNAYRGERDYARAILDYTKAIEIDLRNYDAHIARSQIFVELKDYRQASKDFTSATEIRAKEAESYLSRGLSALTAGDLSSALFHCARAVERNRKNIDAWLCHADAAAAARNTNWAIDDYRAVLQIAPDNQRAVLGLDPLGGGVVSDMQLWHNKTCLSAADPAKPIGRKIGCEQSIAMEPDAAWAYLIRGTMHRENYKYDEAIADFNSVSNIVERAHPNRAAEYRPNFGDVNNNAYVNIDAFFDVNRERGLSYLDRGKKTVFHDDLDLAVADFSKAIDRSWGDIGAYINRGRAYILKKNYELAIADFAIAIDLNANEADAYFARAAARVLKGDRQLAIDDYKKGLLIEPSNRHAIDALRRLGVEQ